MGDCGCAAIVVVGGFALLSRIGGSHSGERFGRFVLGGVESGELLFRGGWRMRGKELKEINEIQRLSATQILPVIC